MMKIHLNFENFFKYFSLHPHSRTLNKHDQTVASYASKVFFILTLGIGYFVCRYLLYDRKVVKILRSPITDIFFHQNGQTNQNPVFPLEKNNAGHKTESFIKNAKSTEETALEVKSKKLPNDLLLDFYRGKGPDIEGRTIQEIWSLNDNDKETIHNYIQWLFPLKTQSAYNKKAPVLNPTLIESMKNDPEIMSNFKRSFITMMNFYGFTYDDATQSLYRAPNFEKRIYEWYTPENHNFLRITRILTSLKIMGLDEEALELLMRLSYLHEAKPQYSRGFLYILDFCF